MEVIAKVLDDFMADELIDHVALRDEQLAKACEALEHYAAREPEYLLTDDEHPATVAREALKAIRDKK